MPGYRPFEAHDRVPFFGRSSTRRLAQPPRGDSWKSEENAPIVQATAAGPLSVYAEAIASL
jgi:hypothetical protein